MYLNDPNEVAQAQIPVRHHTLHLHRAQGTRHGAYGTWYTVQGTRYGNAEGHTRGEGGGQKVHTQGSTQPLLHLLHREKENMYVCDVM